MNLKQKLNEMQEVLSDEQEKNVVDELIFLMFGRKELPKEFQVECCMDNMQLETFLKEKLELDVKEINFMPVSLMMGSPRFKIILN